MERWENTVNIFLLNKYFSSEVSNKAKYHGVGGPLTVTKDSTKTPVIGLLMEAAAELGFKVGDINGEGEDGCFTPGQVRVCSVQYSRLSTVWVSVDSAEWLQDRDLQSLRRAVCRGPDHGAHLRPRQQGHLQRQGRRGGGGEDCW